MGKYNTNAGPDCEFAKIQLDNAILVGNIEIYWFSSEWYQHKHHEDSRYNTTILHVLWSESDGQTICRQDATSIPTLELQHLVDHMLLEKYQHLMEQEAWMPCEKQLFDIPDFHKINWMERLVLESLKGRMELIQSWLNQTNYDWEKVQFIAESRAFGMKVNAEAFEKLLFLLPLSLLHKYANDLHKLEAILFGTAGFLAFGEPEENSCYSSLKLEFNYLSYLHQLPSLSIHEWKFMRMRPHNFLTFRLAQFAELLSRRIQWFEFIKQASLEELTDDLSNIAASSFWNEHFHFGKTAKSHNAVLTPDFIHHLILNAFVPLLFCYGEYIGDNSLKLKALDGLQQLPARKIILRVAMRREG